MTRDEIEKLNAFAAQGWHAGEPYIRGDGQIAVTQPRGNLLAPSVARLLEERERLLEALRSVNHGTRCSTERRGEQADGCFICAACLKAIRAAIEFAEAPTSKDPPTT